MTDADATDVFIYPGQVWYGRGDARVHAIVGAGVVVSAWDPVQRVGGLCHYLMPHPAPGSESAADALYATAAVPALLAGLAARGAAPEGLEIALFGAAALASRTDASAGHVPLAVRNLQAAYGVLQRVGRTPCCEDTGGSDYRQVVLDVRTGHAWSRSAPVPVFLPAGIVAAGARP